MKVRIDSIYDDGLTLFAGNTLLLNDERLSNIMDSKNDLDLIASEHFGARELLRRNIKEDDTEVFKYDMTKINRSIYACMVENLTKFTVLLNSDEYSTEEPTNEYSETIVHGENTQTRNYASRVDTTTHGDVDNTKTYGAQSETLTHGTINTSESIGQQTDQTTNGQRVNTSAVTSFSSSDFNDTDKTTTSSVTDSVQHGAQSNSGSVTQGNDTRSNSTYTDTEGIVHGSDTRSSLTHVDSEKIEHGNDSTTYGAHEDTITNDETTDQRYGYKDLFGNIEKQRKIYSKSVLQMIVTDCVNAITYSMYL